MAYHQNIMERDNRDGDVVLTIPEVEYPEIAAEHIKYVATAIILMRLMQINNNNDEMLGRNVNGENSQLDAEQAIPTSQLLPVNIVDGQSGQNSQVDPGHANPRYEINISLKMNAVCQAGILASPRRIGWSLFILSGLLNAAMIAFLLLKFYQQFRQLREEEYCRWVAQKAAIVVILMASSVCLLFSLTP